jgi:hypothetical protein
MDEVNFTNAPSLCCVERQIPCVRSWDHALLRTYNDMRALKMDSVCFSETFVSSDMSTLRYDTQTNTDICTAVRN